MKIIILSINSYKEKDAIIHGISETEPIDFLVKGIQDPKKGLSALNVPLTEVDVTFLDDSKYKYPVLKEYSLVNSSLNPMNSKNLDQMVTLTFIKDVTLKVLEEEEAPIMYQNILKCLSLIKKDVNPHYVALIYLLRALEVAGFSFQVNECVICGSKKEIVDFNFSEGGFICRNCHSYLETNNYSVSALSAIREIILSVRSFNDIKEECLYKDTLIDKLLSSLIEFTSDALGINLNHFQMLNI